MSSGSVIQPGSPGHEVHARVHFVRHLIEMTIAMMIGMLAGATVFLTAAGMTVDEALRRHPIAFTLVMAFSMTVPMVSWMRHRGHSRRACLAMAAAMVIPAIPLICLRWADVIRGPICSLYCAATILAMIAVMLYRRSEFSGTSAITL